MSNRVLKSFQDKTDNKKLYVAGKDVYESKDSKRISFLVEEGYLEESKEEPDEKSAEDSKDSPPKKGKSKKKAGE